MLGVHTILHPTDFSEQSESAFALASALARDYQARLVVLHVVPIPATLDPEGFVTSDNEEEQAFALDQLHRLELEEKDIQLDSRLEHGAVAANILHVAEESHADLIVMGTHGRSGLSRLLLGSVAEQVMRGAPCPVVTVKMPLAEPETVPALEPTGAEATLL